MPISLILTQYDHFQILPTLAVNPNLILEPCHKQDNFTLVAFWACKIARSLMKVNLLEKSDKGNPLFKRYHYYLLQIHLKCLDNITLDAKAGWAANAITRIDENC